MNRIWEQDYPLRTNWTHYFYIVFFLSKQYGTIVKYSGRKIYGRYCSPIKVGLFCTSTTRTDYFSFFRHTIFIQILLNVLTTFIFGGGSSNSCNRGQINGKL